MVANWELFTKHLFMILGQLVKERRFSKIVKHIKPLFLLVLLNNLKVLIFAVSTKKSLIPVSSLG